MMTIKQSAGGIETIPAGTSWYLADLGEVRGRQESIYPAGTAEAEDTAGTRMIRRILRQEREVNRKDRRTSALNEIWRAV